MSLPVSWQWWRARFTTSEAYLVRAFIVIYEHPELKELHAFVDAARERLAELETAYTVEKSKVDRLQARLFQHLRAHSQERDRLRLVVKYRRQFLDVLLREGDTEAERVGQEYEQAKTRTEREYEEPDKALAAKKELGAEDQEEQAALLRKLWESLELEILAVLEATNRLRESPEFELLGLTAKEPALFDRVVAKHTAQLEKEIAGLTCEAEKLAAEIAVLTSQAAPG